MLTCIGAKSALLDALEPEIHPPSIPSIGATARYIAPRGAKRVIKASSMPEVDKSAEVRTKATMVVANGKKRLLAFHSIAPRGRATPCCRRSTTPLIQASTNQVPGYHNTTKR